MSGRIQNQVINHSIQVFELTFWNFKNRTDFSKLVQQRELLDGQLNENKSVLEELNLLKEDNQVSH